MKNDLKAICEANHIKMWYEEEKKRWCLYGNAAIIGRCLKASQKQYIIIENARYCIDDVYHQIYLLGEIKFAFSELV